MVYGWAARKGAEYQERAMAAPSRRGFVLLAVLEVVLATAFAVFLALAVFASPVAAMGLVALFAYAGGWFLTFAVVPSRAVRWR